MNREVALEAEAMRLLQISSSHSVSGRGLCFFHKIDIIIEIMLYYFNN
jgi:hypothetical protein